VPDASPDSVRGWIFEVLAVAAFPLGAWVCLATARGWPRGKSGALSLQNLAARLVPPPTVLVKSLGYAVMLASEDVEHLLQVVANLVEAAGELDGFRRFERLSPTGEAHERSGDRCGDSVNLASRVTKAADPGTVVVSQAVRDRAPPAFAGRRSRPAS